MAHFARIIERIGRVGLVIGCFFLAVLVSIIVVNIATRPFGAVILGVYSLVVLIAIFIISPAFITAQLKKRQIVADFVTNRIKPSLQAVMG